MRISCTPSGQLHIRLRRASTRRDKFPSLDGDTSPFCSSSLLALSTRCDDIFISSAAGPIRVYCLLTNLRKTSSRRQRSVRPNETVRAEEHVPTAVDADDNDMRQSQRWRYRPNENETRTMCKQTAVTNLQSNVLLRLYYCVIKYKLYNCLVELLNETTDLHSSGSAPPRRDVTARFDYILECRTM